MKIGFTPAADTANKQPAATVSKGSWNAREFVKSGIDKVSSNKDTLFKVAGVAVGLAAVGAAVYYGNDIYSLFSTKNVTSIDPTNPPAESQNLDGSTVTSTETLDTPETNVNSAETLDTPETNVNSAETTPPPPTEGKDEGFISEPDLSKWIDFSLLNPVENAVSAVVIGAALVTAAVVRCLRRAPAVGN